MTETFKEKLDKLLKSRYKKLSGAIEELDRKRDMQQSSQEIEYLARDLDKSIVHIVQKYEDMSGNLSDEEIKSVHDWLKKFRALREKVKEFKEYAPHH